MVRQHQPVLVRGQVHQGEAQQRRLGQVEAPRPVGREERGEPLRALVRAQVAQIELLPARRDLDGDGLDRLVQALVQEADAQVGVPAQQGAGGGLERRRVHRALEVEHELRGVDVHAVGVVERVEEHPLLQRSEGEHVLKLEPGHLRPLHFVCNWSSWAWLSETRGRSEGV